MREPRAEANVPIVVQASRLLEKESRRDACTTMVRRSSSPPRKGASPVCRSWSSPKTRRHNLADCLASTRWADERGRGVDPASRDETLAIAEREADVVAVRTFDDFASQRNARSRWRRATGSSRSTPTSGSRRRSPPRSGGSSLDPANPVLGYRVPIRSVILGRPFAFSGTQHDRPLRLFRRDAGRWTGLVHETVELRGPAGAPERAPASHSADMQMFLRKVNEYTTLEAGSGSSAKGGIRATDLAVRPFWTFVKLYVGKQGFRDGLEGFVFCAMSGVSVAVRHWKHRELTLARGAS